MSPQNYWYQWKGNLSRFYFSSDKKYIFISHSLKIRENLLFLGFFIYFSNRCNFFLANARCNSSMSFWSLDYCLKESLWQKIDFSLEAPGTVNLIFNLLSIMRQCGSCQIPKNSGFSKVKLSLQLLIWKYRAPHPQPNSWDVLHTNGGCEMV